MERYVQFTYDWYEEFLADLKSRGYEFSRFRDEVDSGTVLLRHDVDWSVPKALKLAEIESDLGISSTFHFLFTSPVYNPFTGPNERRIRRIMELGHEIGLHFDPHRYWDSEPPTEEVERTVEQERMVLERVFGTDVPVVSFHNPGRWEAPNGEMLGAEWALGQEYETFINTYAPRFFEDITYSSDSNQRWRDEHPLEGGTPDRIQLLTHPVLYGIDHASTADRLREARDRHVETYEEYTCRRNKKWKGRTGLDKENLP